MDILFSIKWIFLFIYGFFCHFTCLLTRGEINFIFLPTRPTIAQRRRDVIQTINPEVVVVVEKSNKKFVHFRRQQ